MKCVIVLIALAALASVDAAPAPDSSDGTPAAEGKWSDSKFYTGTLDNAQGAIEDIEKADKRLASKEEQLQGLVDGVTTLFQAETIMEDAVNDEDYANSFKTTVTAD